MNDNFMTASEVAEKLGVTPVSVQLWIREGRLRAFKAGKAKNSPYLITVDEFDRFKEGYTRWGRTTDDE